jgi:hypothetical protein
VLAGNDTLLERADAAVADGRILDAIDELTEANRALHDVEVERRLVQLRHAAFPTVRDRPGPSSWPVIEPGGDLVRSGPPSISAAELSPEVLSTGIRKHGCLHVRRLVPEERVERLVAGIDRAITGHDTHASDEHAPTAPWYEPFTPDSEYAAVIKRKRKWVRDASGVWTADSPRVLFDLIDTLNTVGLGAAINAYLGERPVLSANKCTLRRVTLDTTQANWHQDGAFLGDGIRSVNVWMSLSRCGDVAPGLDIVPARLDEIVETGTEGAMFPWTVGPGVIDRLSEQIPVERPIFEAGDVLVFDDLFLHRTGVDSGMTNERYAIETWFFAPSVYPSGQIPLVF